ncbi:hypothetical protein KVK22_06130 [Helicobacter pylori]|nr:hypothetical protein KVK22_06130 [Helicobacter pylori]
MLIDNLHISFDSFNFESILPMLVLVCGGIFTLLINAFTSRFSRNLEVIEIRSLPFLGSLDTKIKEVSYVNR